MRVILKENVKGIGRKFEVKEVADGYANNFLIPRKLAEYASPLAVKKAEEARAAGEAEKEVREKLAEKQLEMLKGVKAVLNKKTNDKGHLFEKIHSEEVSQALKEQTQIDIPPEFLVLEKPIKEKGEHMIHVEVGHNKGEFLLVVNGL